ncbi:MAG: hypothetical protein AABW54_00835 [Candidatus Micrarchaeota archaeon]
MPIYAGTRTFAERVAAKIGYANPKQIVTRIPANHLLKPASRRVSTLQSNILETIARSPKTAFVHTVPLGNAPQTQLSEIWRTSLRNVHGNGVYRKFLLRRPGVRLLYDTKETQVVVAPLLTANHLLNEAPGRFSIVTQSRGKKSVRRAGCLPGIVGMAIVLGGIAKILPKVGQRSATSVATQVPYALMDAETMRSVHRLEHFHTWAALNFILKIGGRSPLDVETLKQTEKLAEQLDLHPLNVLQAYTTPTSKSAARQQTTDAVLGTVKLRSKRGDKTWSKMAASLRAAKINPKDLEVLGDYHEKRYDYNLAVEEWPKMFDSTRNSQRAPARTAR